MKQQLSRSMIWGLTALVVLLVLVMLIPGSTPPLFPLLLLALVVAAAILLEPSIERRYQNENAHRYDLFGSDSTGRDLQDDKLRRYK